MACGVVGILQVFTNFDVLIPEMQAKNVEHMKNAPALRSHALNNGRHNHENFFQAEHRVVASALLCTRTAQNLSRRKCPWWRVRQVSQVEGGFFLEDHHILARFLLLSLSDRSLLQGLFVTATPMSMLADYL